MRGKERRGEAKLRRTRRRIDAFKFAVYIDLHLFVISCTVVILFAHSQGFSDRRRIKIRSLLVLLNFFFVNCD